MQEQQQPSPRAQTCSENLLELIPTTSNSPFFKKTSNSQMFLSTQMFNCTSFSINTCKTASIGPFDEDQVAISLWYIIPLLNFTCLSLLQKLLLQSHALFLQKKKNSPTLSSCGQISSHTAILSSKKLWWVFKSETHVSSLITNIQNTKTSKPKSQA